MAMILRLAASVSACFLGVTSAAAQPASPAPAAAASQPALPYGAPVDLATARRLIERALEVSRARGLRTAVAVVEPSGELVAFARMDDTQYGSIQVAVLKAETSARFRTTTASREAAVQGGRIVTLSIPNLIPIAGGVPIVVNGRVVGALGVSGASAAEDDEVARAALAALAGN